MPSEKEVPLIWLIAGEPSGDLIGARLIVALRERSGGNVRIAGIGGEAMLEEGLESLFPISDIAVMGLIEIIPRIPLIKRRMRETISRIESDRPDIVVSIDVPGFCYDIWKGLRGSDIPLVHYVAPSVWAWRPDRAKKFAAELDYLMTLLPFEPPYFEKEGLDTTFVGHPVLEGNAGNGAGAAFRAAHDISPDQTVVSVLPGSRRGEIRKLLSVFRSASTRIAKRYPEAVFVFPTVSHLEDTVARETAGWPGRSIVVVTVDDKYDAFAASNAAMAASGTVSLELAMARVPHVIAYRMNALTVTLVKMLHGVNQKFANLLNILLDREVVPEFIQEKCTADRVAGGVIDLLEEGETLDRQRASVEQALDALRPPKGTPSGAAADVVMSVLRGNGRKEEPAS
ncbi:MAG: lipid-A-disaccharide synthase [Rhodospirillaceae bacterium]|nr:MAG: lipid-A-disaccharide synthase [Rhodospirillaceae bacterium]